MNDSDKGANDTPHATERDEPFLATFSEAPFSEAPFSEAPISESPISATPVGPPGDSRPARKRRVRLPIVLFLLTCASTFFAGACGWLPLNYLFAASEVYINPSSPGLMPMRQSILKHWDEGLIYMACLIAILLTHEMGHFIATLFHRIPASFPYCIPFPISPFGTMGAVIGMDGSRSNRPQTFDIGLAGPLAGLVVAIPILMYGIQQLDLSQPEYGFMGCDPPLAVKLAFEYWRRPPGYEPGDVVWMGQMNPYFMAGWVGLFITGMNMLPLSQLDGGHIIYTLFGRSRALWIARGFMVAVIAYTVYSDLIRNIWLMVALLLLIGPDHPPTRDDSAPMGWFRYALGGISLLIPVFCFPLRIIVAEGGF